MTLHKADVALVTAAALLCCWTVLSSANVDSHPKKMQKSLNVGSQIVSQPDTFCSELCVELLPPKTAGDWWAVGGPGPSASNTMDTQEFILAAAHSSDKERHQKRIKEIH